MVLEIKNFAVLHFSTEKRYMEKVHYPYTADHLKEHDFFLETISLIESGLKGLNTNGPLDLLLILKKWFVKHLTSTDKKFYIYMQKEAPEDLKMLGF
jgi:hemerythrin